MHPGHKILVADGGFEYNTMFQALKTHTMDSQLTGLSRDFEDIKVGERAEFTKQIQQKDVEAFSQLTGDFNPIHLDEQFAKQTFFRGRIVQGMLTGSFISRIIGMSLPGHGGIYLSQSLKFLKAVRVDEPIRVVAEVKRKNNENRTLVLSTEVFNSRNEPVVTGQAEVMIPKKRKGNP